ncbi:unnamed protein product, partial [Polarella glacialis]
DVTGRWRRVVAAGCLKESADGWMPVSHPVLGCLAQPLESQTDTFPRAWTLDAPCPSYGMSAAEARHQLHLRGSLRLPGGAPPGPASCSAEADALFEVFRSGRTETAEGEAALAKLDPGTVKSVLAAALQHLEEKGVRLEIKAGPLT